MDSPRQVISWKDIQLDPGTKSYKDCIIGKGSFGHVFRAKYVPAAGSRVPRDVAIKVVTQSLLNDPRQYQKHVEMFSKEVEVMNEVNQKITDLDCIVRVYGDVVGKLPAFLASIFQLNTVDECAGIVMRYEAGGSLEKLLYSQDGVEKPLDIIEKFRLLTGIARGLAELHGCGFVHGDLKPGNILLSSHSPAEVRLADFGMSSVRGDFESNTESTLNLTTHTKGTPVYNAPEKMFNPSMPDQDTVSSSTRKTDIYAFAVIMWEVMTRSRPFPRVRDGAVLAGKVHRGERPPLEQLPPEVGEEVSSMIADCWSADRSQRHTAAECLSILDQRYSHLSSDRYDIFLSYKSENRPLVGHIYNLLTQSNYRIWFDQNDIRRELESSMTHGIANSAVVVACVNEMYQESRYCMFEVEKASELQKPIIPIVLKPGDPTIWANATLQSHCKFDQHMYTDMSAVAALPGEWVSGQDPSEDSMKQLKSALKSLVKLLDDVILQKPDSRNNSRATSVDLSGMALSPLQIRSTGASFSPAASPSKVSQQQNSPGRASFLFGPSSSGRSTPAPASQLTAQPSVSSSNPARLSTKLKPPVGTDAKLREYAKEGKNKYQFLVNLLNSYDFGATIDSGDHYQYTALMWATMFGHLDTAKLLIERGANVNSVDNNQNTSLIFASSSGHNEVVKLLLDKGANINSADYNRNTALMRVSSIGHTETATILLQRGADINCTAKDGSTALMKSSACGHLEIASLLLNRGADVRPVDKDGWSALTFASSRGHTQIAKLLLEKGANVNSADINGFTPLIWATRNGHTEIVKLLLEAGANIDSTDLFGKTALIWASADGYADILELLLAHRANVNCADKTGSTALAQATKRKLKDVVKLLVSKGAK